MNLFYLLLTIIIIGTIQSQVVPYIGTPYLNKDQAENIKNIPQEILHSISQINQTKRNQYIFDFSTDSESSDLHIYIFDEKKSSSGPYYFKQGTVTTNPFTCKECYILINDKNSDEKINLVKISTNSKPIDFIYQDQAKYNRFNKNRENPIILVTGFWPPTNEMIRHFSQNLNLNPTGWQGDNWEDRGYDIISYFPEFSNPECTNCGQGYGDLEVDYQDTSNDFWDIVENISPSAIITFSRGFNDLSWEMEYNFYNRTNWYNDYLAPTLPTPNPPESNVANFFMRNSSLPVENLVTSINNSNIGLDAYVDWNGDPGRFVSEFMGYHGVWYKELNSQNEIACLSAGHIHVGAQIDWNTAKQAAEISIREIINYINQFTQESGDVNNDQNVNVLDIIQMVNVILGEGEFTAPQFYAADINNDGSLNIQDIVLTINIILLN